MLLGEALHQLHVAVGLIVGTIGHLLLHLLQTFGHGRMVVESFARLIKHRSVVGNLHHLRQVTDGAAIGHVHTARCGLLQSIKQFEHGRLAGTVLTY